MDQQSLVFLSSKTKWKRLLRRLELHVTLAFSSLLYVFQTSIVPCQSSKGRVKGLFVMTRDQTISHHIRAHMHSHCTCILTVQLAQPIRRYAHWRTRVFKIDGFVCKGFLPSFPSPSPSFIFWLSFHFLSGQNRESRSSIFFHSKTKRKRLLPRPSLRADDN